MGGPQKMDGFSKAFSKGPHLQMDDLNDGYPHFWPYSGTHIGDTDGSHGTTGSASTKPHSNGSFRLERSKGFWG